MWTGWYGIGGGSAAGAENLRSELTPLVADHHLRTELGIFGRRLVTGRFSLTRAAEIQERIYLDATTTPPPRLRLAETVALSRYSSYYLRKRIRRLRGITARDDFNARPVTAINKEVTS